MRTYYYQLFTLSESAKIRDTIYSLRNNWIERNSSFFTLGRAAYLDCPNDTYKNIDQLNNLLRKNFGLVYEKLFYFLKQILGSSVDFSPIGQIPGFQIYLPSVIYSYSKHFPPHLDTQILYVLKNNNINLQDFMSYTVSIEVPRKGAGLEYWEPIEPLPEDVFKNLTTLTRIDYNDGPLKEYFIQVSLHTPKFIEYKNGNIFAHHGLYFHRPVIGTYGQKFPRITLQGHCVRRGDKFITFW